MAQGKTIVWFSKHGITIPPNLLLFLTRAHLLAISDEQNLPQSAWHVPFFRKLGRLEKKMKVKNAHQRDFILAFFAVARAKLRKPSVQKHEKVPVFWSIFTVADPPAGRGQEKKNLLNGISTQCLYRSTGWGRTAITMIRDLLCFHHCRVRTFISKWS